MDRERASLGGCQVGSAFDCIGFCPFKRSLVLSLPHSRREGREGWRTAVAGGGRAARGEGDTSGGRWRSAGGAAVEAGGGAAWRRRMARAAPVVGWQLQRRAERGRREGRGWAGEEEEEEEEEKRQLYLWHKPSSAASTILLRVVKNGVVKRELDDENGH
uniref:Uncharacterized protein n=1 Tax=Oryza punctata TaxID=4537 RepID=A0A0E0LC55_ORYPU